MPQFHLTHRIPGCKWSLALAMSCYILFMVAHFYATWGLFIPTAIILGIGAAPLWTSKGQYLNIVSTSYLWSFDSFNIQQWWYYPFGISRLPMILLRKQEGPMMLQQTSSSEYFSCFFSRVSNLNDILLSARAGGSCSLWCGILLAVKQVQ